MGIIGNFSVYALLVLPAAMMIKGHHITLSRHITLGIFIAVVQLLHSVLLSAMPGPGLGHILVQYVILPFTAAMFNDYVLNDYKAAKMFGLKEYSDSAAATATVATLWAIADVILNHWFGWYRTMSSLGYVAENMRSGVLAFCYFLSSLAVCRIMQSSSEVESNTTTTSVQSVVMQKVGSIVAVHLIAALVGSLLLPHTSLAIPAVTVALLYALLLFVYRQPVAKGPASSPLTNSSEAKKK